jgi:hypothetical protein
MFPKDEVDAFLDVVDGFLFVVEDGGFVMLLGVPAVFEGFLVVEASVVLTFAALEAFVGLLALVDGFAADPVSNATVVRTQALSALIAFRFNMAMLAV